MRAAFLVQGRQPAGRSRGDRAHRKMNAVAQAGQQALGTERHLLQGRVVGDHRDHDAAGLDRLGRAARQNRAAFHQRPGLFGRAVIDTQPKTRLQQIRRHRKSHPAQTDEADGLFHGALSSPVLACDEPNTRHYWADRRTGNAQTARWRPRSISTSI